MWLARMHDVTRASGRSCARLSSSLADVIANNAIASGGLTVLAAGTSLALARSGGRLLLDMLLRRCVARAEFDSRDDSYRWMTALLSGHESLSDTKRFTVSTTLGRLGESSSAAATGVLLIPTGTSLIRFDRRWVVAVRERQDDSRSVKERESLTLHVLFGSRSDVLAIVHKAKAQYEQLCRQRISISFLDEYGSWNSAGTRAARPLTSVILQDPTAAAYMLSDCRRFLECEQVYASKGIPYRRGYLLAGVPGSGKTSLVLSLAAELGLPVYVVPADARNLADSAFADALATGTKAPSIVLIEDVDAALRTTRAGPPDSTARLTLAGLLNALDGALAQEGRLIFMTTNNVERLDPALLRPGRVDVRLDFGPCTLGQLRRYACHFYPEANPDAMATLLPSKPRLSMAEVQAIFCQHPDSPADAARALHSATNARKSKHVPQEETGGSRV